MKHFLSSHHEKRKKGKKEKKEKRNFPGVFNYFLSILHKTIYCSRRDPNPMIRIPDLRI